MSTINFIIKEISGFLGITLFVAFCLMPIVCLMLGGNL